MNKEFHVITTGQQSEAQLVDILSNIHPYVDMIHLREKTKTAKELSQIIMALIEKGVPKEKLVINDRVDVAVAFNVKGVQLAYHSLNAKVVKENFPTLRVGCSIHSKKEAIKAHKDGADYTIYGHVYETSCKPNSLPRGLKELEEIVKKVKIPVLAIGGVKPDRVQDILKTGASGIAVMSGVLLADDPVRAAKGYASILKNWGVKHEYPKV